MDTLGFIRFRSESILRRPKVVRIPKNLNWCAGVRTQGNSIQRVDRLPGNTTTRPAGKIIAERRGLDLATFDELVFVFRTD